MSSLSLEIIDEKIKKQLINKLTSTRKILEEQDLFINEEHKQLCYYYKKYMELKTKLKTKNKKLTIRYMKIIFDDDNNIEYIPIEYYYNIKWNEYNKKFVNKLNYVFNYDYINVFLQQQHLFLSSLTKRELFNIKYYTYHGDIYINNFIQGTFSLDLIKGYSGNLVSTENNLCYFFYQLKDYFNFNKYNNEVIDTNDDDLFISFIRNECFNFDMKIYDYIFKKYIVEMNEIFKKAPRTTDKLILYRGISFDYITSKLKKDFYKNSQFSSTSLFIEKAFDYTSNKNRMIMKINVNIGMPLIFVEGITLAEKDFEIIIPLNAIFLLKHPFKQVNYYKNKEDLLCPDENVININMIELNYIY